MESQSETVKTKKGSPHYTIVEDEALCRAWSDTSEDGIVSVNQTHQRLWERIHTEYLRQMPNSTRSVDGLSCRWKGIKKDVHSYMNIYQSTIDKQHTGNTVDQIVKLVRSTFRDDNGHAFILDHCYLILKDSPKWIKAFERRASLKLTSKSKGKTPSQSPPINLESDTINPSIESSQDTQGPEGVKANPKSKRKIFGESLTLVEEFFTRLEKSVGDSPELAIDREFRDKELEVRLKEVRAKNKATVERKKARIAKARETEVKILTTDTSTMSVEVKIVWEKRCNGIMERWKVGNYDGEPIEIEIDDDDSD